MSRVQHIGIKGDGHLLAEVVMETLPDLVDAHLQVEAAQLPPGALSRLVDAVLEIPNVHPGTHLEITFPTGVAEVLEQFRNRCPDVTTRCAGSRCRLHATFPSN